MQKKLRHLVSALSFQLSLFLRWSRKSKTIPPASKTRGTFGTAAATKPHTYIAQLLAELNDRLLNERNPFPGDAKQDFVLGELQSCAVHMALCRVHCFLLSPSFHYCFNVVMCIKEGFLLKRTAHTTL